MLVLPETTKPRLVDPKTSRRYGITALGCGYILASTASSVYYLFQFDPASANDLWWAKYTPNGHQALTVDIFNMRLATRASGSTDVLAATIDKTYADDAAATTEMYSSYPRRLVLQDFTSVEYAVTNLRVLNAPRFGFMLTQYCYVDLAKAFEVAHTASRQQRCANRHSANGAVFFETVLRNLIWDDFLAFYGGDGGMFTVAIQVWLEQLPAGQKWLATTAAARATTTTAQEAAYWRSMNISYFKLQWHNRWHTGVDETMEIENALGLRSTITLKRLAYATTTWTSTVMYWTVLYDLYFMASFNRSLIRSADNTFTESPAIDFESLISLQAENHGTQIESQVDLFRAMVGPFRSVDTYYVAVPAALLALYDAFHSRLDDALATSGLSTAFNAIPTIPFQPTPPAWSNSNHVFYGGNPMCLYHSALPYVQDTFSFSDPCVTLPPLLVTATKYSSLFAAMALGNQFQP
ncbi:hypothetical protein As57867_002278, partial [Aphanomyces stellatus]